MGAHTLVRFRQIEVQLREAAERTLADPAATLVAKREARRTLHETLIEAQRRRRAKNAKDALGPQPRRQDFATEEEFVRARDAYRTGLDRLACEEILDTPNPLGKRNLARRTLDAIERQERLSGTPPAPRKREAADSEPRAPRPVPDDGLSPDVANFFAGLADDGNPDVSRSADTSGPRAPQPAPQAAQLHCEKHTCPIKICGCNTICPKCLLERRICGHTKEKK